MWPGLYGKIISFLHIVVWHMKVSTRLMSREYSMVDIPDKVFFGGRGEGSITINMDAILFLSCDVRLDPVVEENCHVFLPPGYCVKDQVILTCLKIHTIGHMIVF